MTQLKSHQQPTLSLRSTGCTPAWEVNTASRIDRKHNTDSKWSSSFKKKKELIIHFLHFCRVVWWVLPLTIKAAHVRHCHIITTILILSSDQRALLPTCKTQVDPMLSCSIHSSKIITSDFKTYKHIMNLHKENRNNVGQLPCCCLLPFFFN